MVERAPGQVQELQRIVKLCAVGAVRIDYLLFELFQVRAKKLGLQHGLAGVHPVDVATDRVDLAVVDQIAVGMGALPRRERVGAEARVNDGDGRFHVRVQQVGIVSVDLVGQQHALVHDGAAGEAGNVEAVALLVPVVANRPLGALADDVELAFEGQRVAADERIGDAADEYLAHERLPGNGCRAERTVVGRHGAPAEYGLALLAHDLLEFGLEGGALAGVLG